MLVTYTVSVQSDPCQKAHLVYSGDPVAPPSDLQMTLTVSRRAEAGQKSIGQRHWRWARQTGALPHLFGPPGTATSGLANLHPLGGNFDDFSLDQLTGLAVPIQLELLPPEKISVIQSFYLFNFGASHGTGFLVANIESQVPGWESKGAIARRHNLTWTLVDFQVQIQREDQIADASFTDRLMIAARQGWDHLWPSIYRDLQGIATPDGGVVLGVLVAFFVALHFIGAGEVIDILAVMFQIAAGAAHLGLYIEDAWFAKDDPEKIHEASDHFVEFLKAVGSVLIAGMVAKLLGKVLPAARTAGPAEKPVTMPENPGPVPPGRAAATPANTAPVVRPPGQLPHAEQPTLGDLGPAAGPGARVPAGVGGGPDPGQMTGHGTAVATMPKTMSAPRAVAGSPGSVTATRPIQTITRPAPVSAPVRPISATAPTGTSAAVVSGSAVVTTGGGTPGTGGGPSPNYTRKRGDLDHFKSTDIRPVSTVGDGSTAAAVYHEIATLAQVKGKWHYKKARSLAEGYLKRFKDYEKEQRKGDLTKKEAEELKDEAMEGYVRNHDAVQAADKVPSPPWPK